MTFLLMTSRSRCEPASGAKVSPVRLPPDDEPGQVHGERVDAQRRERDGHRALPEPRRQAAQDLLDAASGPPTTAT